MNAKFEEVERPNLPPELGAKRDPNSLVGQLRATAETGKAIRVSRGSRAQYVHGQLARQGYKLYTRTDGEYVICWCEKIKMEDGGEHSQ
mgnify:FL=1